MMFKLILTIWFYYDVKMMLHVFFFFLHRQSITAAEYFILNVKRTMWLKRYQNGNHIEPSEQLLQ